MTAKRKRQWALWSFSTRFPDEGYFLKPLNCEGYARLRSLAHSMNSNEYGRRYEVRVYFPPADGGN